VYGRARKVLKPGNGQTGWAFEATCTGSGNNMGGCGALLRVEATDLFKTHNDDHGGGRYVYSTFRCPQCRVLTDVPSKVSLPNEVRNQIPETEGEWAALPWREG
jgi:hypothetical protein